MTKKIYVQKREIANCRECPNKNKWGLLHGRECGMENQWETMGLFCVKSGRIITFYDTDDTSIPKWCPLDDVKE